LVAALRRRAAWLIWVEALAQAVAPSVFLLLAYVAAALFGFANPWLFAVLLGLAVISLVIGAVKLRPPTRDAIDRRIEAASGFRHRPLAALDDQPEDDSPVAAQLWSAHRRRVLESLAAARIGPPAPAAAMRDPWALRALLALLLLSGLIIAGPAIPGRLVGAFLLPAWPFAGPVVTAWITPPDYAGQPPLLLQPGQVVSALAGAKLTIIVDGPRGAPRIVLAGTRLGSIRLGDSSHRADATLQSSGALLVGPWWHRLARWQVNIMPPGAPVITFTGLDITQGNHFRLHWHVTDPYGLQSVTATLAPVGHPNALTQSFHMATNTGDAAGSLDLTTSPFHLLQNTLTLTAENVAGKTASAGWNVPVTFPGLGEQTAAGLVLDNLRQQIAIDPLNIRLVAGAMQRLSQAPPSHISAAADIKLAVLTCAIWLRETGPRPAVDRMLALIQEIEAGPDYAPAQALAAANQALEAALRRGLDGQKIGDAVLQRLLAAMHEALASHLAATRQDGAPPNGAPGMDMSTLDRMAEKIAADEAAGRNAQAAQELRQLQAMLNQLASAKPMTAQQMAQSAAAQEAAQAIAQMTQEEADLLDHTSHGDYRPDDQGGLQNQLTDTQKNLAKTGLTVPGLGDAGSAMAGAKDALLRQNGGQAETQENAAIQALQKAAAALAAAQRSNFGIGQGQPGIAGQDQDGPNGGPDEQTVPLNLGNSANPARMIEQQIINQDSSPAVPATTHSYYHRLLQDGVGP
jgi:hypothetical protein